MLSVFVRGDVNLNAEYSLDRSQLPYVFDTITCILGFFRVAELYPEHSVYPLWHELLYQGFDVSDLLYASLCVSTTGTCLMMKEALKRC